MSSTQKSLISYFKRKEIVENYDNNSTKKNKTNDNPSNIVNDNATTSHATPNIEPPNDIQLDINENCSLSTTTTTPTNDKKNVHIKNGIQEIING
jgi:hypothetical protein